jgi:hypothetical protein
MPAIWPLKVDLGKVSHLAAAWMLDKKASEITLEILISRSIINNIILKILIFFWNLFDIFNYTHHR